MKYMKKVSLFVLIASITSASMLSCNKLDKKVTDTSKQQNVSETDNVELSNETVLSVGDIDVSYKELLLYMQSYKDKYENLYGADIWSYKVDAEGKTFESVFKDDLLEDIIYIKTVCAQAQELGITLAEDELLDVDELTASFFGTFSEAQMTKYKIDIETVKKVYMDNMLANKIYESLTLNVDTDVTDEEARQIKLQYAFVSNASYDEDGTRIEYTEEQQQKAKEKAIELRKKALEASSFYQFAAENSENKDEIEMTVGKGDMEASLEKVAFSMKTGEISEVIETSSGYFILYCVSDLDREATDVAKEELISKRQEEAFDTKYKEWAKSTKVKLNKELWNNISFDDTLFE